MSFTSETIAVPGGPAQRVLRGGRGAPLVWLHGIARPDPDDAVLEALGKRFEVIAPIAPGYDDLTQVDDIRDVHDLALHYDSLLGAMGLERVSLAGHSFGGMIAAEVAAHTPSRVGRLVLFAPIGLWDDRYPSADLSARPAPEMEALIWQGARQRPEPKAAADAPQGAERVEQLVQLASGLATVAKFTWPIPDKGLRRRLHRISAPTTVIWGEGDGFIPAAYAAQFAAGIPGSAAKVVPGSHMLPYEDPDRTAALVADAVGATEAAA